jgi:CelD/BcsL family acetyltransferase involved in cellulose biosynthesis
VDAVKVLWQEGFAAAPTDEWARLVEADPEATPFVSPAWVGSWLRHLGDPGRLVTVSVWCDGEPVGIAPLVREQRGPARVLAGAGQIQADHWDVVARPELRREVWAAVVADLIARRRSWDMLDLDHIPGTSPFPPLAGTAGLRLGPRRTAVCPRLDLPGTFDAYLGQLPQSRRGHLRRRLRQLERGDLELHEVPSGDLGPALERWQAIRVRELGGKGVRINPVHATAGFRRFLEGVIGGLAPLGRAQLVEFRAGGRVVGSYVSLLDRRGHYLYLGGYEPEARSLGLGMVVVGEAIRAGIAAGREFVDFGRGGEDYKYWYGAVDTRVDSFVAGHGGPRSSLVLTSRSAWSAARRRAARARVRRVG